MLYAGQIQREQVFSNMMTSSWQTVSFQREREREREAYTPC